MNEEERKQELDSEYDGCDQTGCMKALKKIFGAILLGLLIFSCSKIATDKQASQNNNDTTSALDHPNVIVLVADDIGYEVLTCDGGSSYQTPNLDLIALNGMRFTQCHGCPACSPSRHELMTGKYNFRNYTYWSKMNPNEKTIGNMFRDAGYSTAWFGKDQLDGGATSAYNWGFDKYVLYNPFTPPYSDTDELAGGSRYRSPRLYAGENGQGEYIDANLLLNKYGDDVFTDSLIAFMATPSTQPKFVYYTIAIGHNPCQPTPDDPTFLTFAGGNHPEFFPSMVKYMDKKIGQIKHALDSLGLSDNTIILFTGDNGTSAEHTSVFNGDTIRGYKGGTSEFGTHVPLIVQYPNSPTYSIGVDSDLIDFTDFLPTLADMAGIPKPTDYGILDGQSFYSGEKRKAIFCSYQKNPELNSPKIWWAQNYLYKKYDSTFYSPDYKKGALFRVAQYKERVVNVITNPNYLQKPVDSFLYSVIQSYK